MVTEILALLATLLLLIYVFSWVRSSRGLPPGPPRYPLIGSLPSMINGSVPIHKTITEMAKKYGDVLTVYFPTGKGCKPFVVINSYETAHDAMITQKDAFSGRPATFTADYITRGGEGLGFSDFTPKTALIRKVVLKALRLYQPNLEGKILEEAGEIVKQFSSYSNQPFDPRTDFSLAIVNVVFSIIYGKRYELHDEEFLEFNSTSQRITQVLNPLNIVNFFPFLINFPIPSSRLLHSVVEYRIQAREPRYFQEKNTFQEGHFRHLVDALLQAKMEEETDINSSSTSTLSDLDLQATIDALFGAGSETTATTLRWLLAYALNFPQIQENLYAEVKEVFGEHGEITLKKRNDCHYLEATLTEILRHACIAPMFIHKTTRDTTLSGHSIPKDTAVLLNIWAINHDERHWENPQQFNPERFLDSEGHFTGTTRKMSYMPFGAGRRVCIGESLAKTELFVISATLLQKFKFETPDGCTPPDLSKEVLGLARAPLPFKVTAIKR